MKRFLNDRFPEYLPLLILGLALATVAEILAHL